MVQENNAEIQISDDENTMLREIFLMLWDISKESPRYDKHLWQEFRALLKEKKIDL